MWKDVGSVRPQLVDLLSQSTLGLMWLKQCHKPSPHHHFYRWYQLFPVMGGLWHCFPVMGGLWHCFNHIYVEETSNFSGLLTVVFHRWTTYKGSSDDDPLGFFEQNLPGLVMTMVNLWLIYGLSMDNLWLIVTLWQWHSQFANWKIAIESSLIYPWKMHGDFPVRYVNVYQRVGNTIW